MTFPIVANINTLDLSKQNYSYLSPLLPLLQNYMVWHKIYALSGLLCTQFGEHM